MVLTGLYVPRSFDSGPSALYLLEKQGVDSRTKSGEEDAVGWIPIKSPSDLLGVEKQDPPQKPLGVGDVTTTHKLARLLSNLIAKK